MAKPVPSAALLELQGKPPHVSRAVEPDFIGGRPQTPDYFSPATRKLWKRFVSLLSKRGTLTKLDGVALEILCIQYERWLAAKKEIGEDYFCDVPVFDSTGAQVGTRRDVNPAVKVLEKSESLMRTQLASIGASPDSRRVRQMTRQGKRKNLPPVEGTVAWMLAEADGENE